ncbi:MAG: hypothetical protein HY787_27895 [Deltaproteobacteria bacterium]|nr:hypothetical protein [Deltaproteobacteria bacterium]
MTNWKKWFCFLCVLGAFLVWGSFDRTWAGEKELIELLIKKNIITQGEADQLLKESESNAQKKKMEIKKEVKAEVQEEIKKEADKGDLLPPALRGFKFGTTIFGEWNFLDRAAGTNTNQFALNRAYVTLTKDFNSWLGMNFTSDLFTAKDPDDVNNGFELRIKYAFISLKLLGTESLLGLTLTPSDYYDSAIWPYRVQGKNLLDDLGIQSTADLGVANRGVFGGYMDDDYLKYAARPFSGKWGGYMVGVYNGSGFDTAENNNNKVLSGLVYVRPFPMFPILKGLQLAYTGTYGESNTSFAPGSGPVTSFPSWQVNIGQISLQHPYFTIMGQYYWGKGTKASNEENDRKGYLVSGFLRIPSFEKLRVFSKWYYYDPNTNRSDDERNVYVAGLSYDLTREFMPFVAWERLDGGANSGLVDSNKYQLGFQLKF